jgi:TatA/E family protein of Tat protein translocase
MFGSLGFPELLMIFVVALIVFGPRRLPEIGKTLGKALGEFKKATDELKKTIEKEVAVEELKEFKNIMPSNLFNPTVSRTEPVAAVPVVAAAAVKGPRWPELYQEPSLTAEETAAVSEPGSHSALLEPGSPSALAPAAVPVHALTTQPDTGTLTHSASTPSDAGPAPTLAETGKPGRAE